MEVGSYSNGIVWSESEEILMLEVKETRLVAQPTVVIRAKVHPDQLGPVMSKLFPVVMAFVQDSVAEPAGPPFSRYLCINGNDEEWDIACGIPVSRPLTGAGQVEASELPGGAAVTTMHRGRYETLGASWAALQRWVKDNGKAPGEPPWEIYRTDPREVKDPAEWRTEIVIPVQEFEAS